MTYYRFVRSYPYLLGFGFLHAFFSWPGQTFFIALYLPLIREQFHLSNSEFGLFYSAATLLGALSLPLIGQKIDSTPVPRYSLLTILVTGVSCLGLAYAQNKWQLFLSLYGLRLTSQCLMGHISSTTMIKHFGPHRGRALGITNLGYPFTEATVPFLMGLFLEKFSWQSSWLVCGAMILLIFLPLSQFLIRHQKAYHNAFEEEEENINDSRGTTSGTTVRQVFHDPRFYLLLPMLLIPSLTLTGMFFYHTQIATQKGWPEHTLTHYLFFYASMRVLFSLISGDWVDRFTATKILPYQLIPMTISFFILAFSTSAQGGWMYLVFSGIAVGVGNTVKTACWAELYGTKNIGAIRSWVNMIVIIASALSPSIIGSLLDSGININLIFIASGLLTAISTLMAFYSQKFCSQKIVVVIEPILPKKQVGTTPDEVKPIITAA